MDKVTYTTRKDRERTYTTIPVFEPRQSIQDVTRVIGWKFQIFNGWGRIIHESPCAVLYGSSEEAQRAAREFE